MLRSQASLKYCIWLLAACGWSASEADRAVVQLMRNQRGFAVRRIFISAKLLGAVCAGPRDEFLRHRFAELDASRVVDLVVDPRPYARVARFFPEGPNFVGMRGE